MAGNRQLYEKALTQGKKFNEHSQWKDAFSAFRAAIGEFPKEPEPYAGLAEACLGLKQLDKALDCYKLAVRYSRGDVAYLQKVADIQERKGQLHEAGRTYMAAGEILFRKRQLEDAIGNWQRAVRLEPNLLAAHRRLAMIFQRQNQTRDAVRSYLAIARILQARGENDKALQMCRAALRLDPDNDDVIRAVELIRYGAAGFEEKEEEATAAAAVTAPSPVEEEEDSVAATVRQMAKIFEQELQQNQQTEEKVVSDDPLEAARRKAQEALAEEIFRDEDSSDEVTDENSLSKLERDALIGEGMDFESRGRIDDAISCFERAILGGLQLPAAHFSLGMLYLDKGDVPAAQQALKAAAHDPLYREAIKAAFDDLN